MEPNGQVSKDVELVLKNGRRCSKDHRETLERLYASYKRACQIATIRGPRQDRWREIAMQRERELKSALGENRATGEKPK